jgi:hypothetical protein
LVEIGPDPKCWIAGLGVANHGSPVLDRTFPDETTDALAFWFALVAYIGIAFPALWGEVAGLIATSTMIGTLGAAMLFVAESPSTREFLSWLVLGDVVFVFDGLCCRLSSSLRPTRLSRKTWARSRSNAPST